MFRHASKSSNLVGVPLLCLLVATCFVINLFFFWVCPCSAFMLAGHLFAFLISPTSRCVAIYLRVYPRMLTGSCFATDYTIIVYYIVQGYTVHFRGVQCRWYTSYRQ